MKAGGWGGGEGGKDEDWGGGGKDGGGTQLTAMRDVLSTMNTCSMATVGTSDMRMRRSALAMEGSMPIMSNSQRSGDRSLTLILQGHSAM